MHRRIQLNPWIDHQPSEPQLLFLMAEDGALVDGAWWPVKEKLYGGAAGGGKSDALLMDALKDVVYGEHHALLMRRTYPDLTQDGALIPRSHEWLRNKRGCYWHGAMRKWHFETGATIAFRHMQDESDKYGLQSAEFSMIGFDELTQFSLTQYTFSISRLRRTKGGRVFPHAAGATNPVGVGQEWVYLRFLVEGRKARDPLTGNPAPRVFIPAKLRDNPHLDYDEYAATLASLDPVTRMQLLEGNWHVRATGGKFKGEWFRRVDRDQVPPLRSLVRYWDLAGTKPLKPGTDPDYTVGVLMGLDARNFIYVIDVQRRRCSPGESDKLVRTCADLDREAFPDVEYVVGMEQEPGASAVILMDHFSRVVLPDVSFLPLKVGASKEARAMPYSSKAEAGYVAVVRGEWLSAYLQELETFPQEGFHDDQVDASSGAFTLLAKRGAMNWDDAYGIVTCRNERCGNKFYLPDTDKSRPCPRCGTQYQKPEEYTSTPPKSS